MGLGFRIQGSGARAWLPAYTPSPGLGVYGFGVQDAYGYGFRIQGLGI